MSSVYHFLEHCVDHDNHESSNKDKVDVQNALYTVFQKKLVHQAHIDNLVNSQRIFIIRSLAHFLENLR